jgi:hypothetical protein
MLLCNIIGPAYSPSNAALLGLELPPAEPAPVVSLLAACAA